MESGPPETAAIRVLSFFVFFILIDVVFVSRFSALVGRQYITLGQELYEGKEEFVFREQADPTNV
jgi:hypothetical protein